MMQALMNQVRLECARLFAKFSRTRIGVVSSVDCDNYRCKVLLQPENKETGWLPIKTPWSGNGWGAVCPPSKGDIVEVQFQEGDIAAGIVGGRFYANIARAPAGCSSGEFWLIHQSGSLLKFKNDGSVDITANLIMTLTAPTINMDASTKITLTTPVVEITGALTSGTASGGNATFGGTVTATGDVVGSGTSLHTHVHGGVQTGGGNTGVPV